MPGIQHVEDSVFFLYWTQTFPAAGHQTQFMLKRGCLVEVRKTGKQTAKREERFFFLPPRYFFFLE